MAKQDPAKPRSLLASDGPNTVHAEGLDKLRAKPANAVKESGAGGTTPSAAMKMLKHLYRHSKSGAQDVWIYSPPKDHAE